MSNLAYDISCGGGFRGRYPAAIQAWLFLGLIIFWGEAKINKYWG